MTFYVRTIDAGLAGIVEPPPTIHRSTMRRVLRELERTGVALRRTFTSKPVPLAIRSHAFTTFDVRLTQTATVPGSAVKYRPVAATGCPWFTWPANSHQFSTVKRFLFEPLTYGRSALPLLCARGVSRCDAVT